jgi:hypothetical protein
MQLQLRSSDVATKWFVWSCDHLLFTVTREYGEGKPREGERRTGAFYVQNGTTLCHVFWAMLWVPLATVAAGSLVLFIFIAAHVQLYEDNGYKWGIAAAFMPEIVLLLLVTISAIIVFAIMGASKVGFFKMLWEYLKRFKSRICPLVSFER